MKLDYESDKILNVESGAVLFAALLLHNLIFNGSVFDCTVRAAALSSNINHQCSTTAFQATPQLQVATVQMQQARKDILFDISTNVLQYHQ